MFDMERLRESVAAELRAEMGRKNIKASQLSDATGIPAATLSRKLNGHAGLSLDELFKIADALGASASSIVRAATDSQSRSDDALVGAQ